MDSHTRLGQLAKTYPLPNAYALQEPFFDQLELGLLKLGMAGLVAIDGESHTEALGAAAEPGIIPVDRAYFELLERVCTLIAMQPHLDHFPEVDRSGSPIGYISRCPVFPGNVHTPPGTRSVSNGVALHRTYARACRAALNELLERDALLRAWYGWLETIPIQLPDSPFQRWAVTHYHVYACQFGHHEPERGYSIGILARPKDPKRAPLLFSSAGGATLSEAVGNAEREALQRLCFLWGEDIPKRAPQFSTSVDYHQAYYLVPDHHTLLERFCRVGHTALATKAAAPPPVNTACVRFADLTPPTLSGGLKVVRAVCPNALPVLFGHCELASGLPPALQVHPIS